MIDAVIFDMDGLLIDSEHFWQEEERNAFEKLGVTIPAEIQEQTYGLGIFEVVRFIYNYQPWQGKSFEALGNEILENVKNRILAEAELKPGVDYILDFFRNKPVKIGLASSSPQIFIEDIVQQFGIAPVFDVMHSAEHEKYTKRHPGVYLTTAEMLHVDPLHCLAFEDSFNGLIAAIAARMKTVAVPDANQFKFDKYKIADVLLRSLNEFTETQYSQLNN